MSFTRRTRGTRVSRKEVARPEPDELSVEVLFADSRCRVRDRKVSQLCAQVARAISYALAGCGDAVLSDLCVECVEPFPHGGRLLVTVRPWSEGPDTDRLHILERLEAARGWLRSEVASEIHRKRTPELVFESLHAEEESP